MLYYTMAIHNSYENTNIKGADEPYIQLIKFGADYKQT